MGQTTSTWSSMPNSTDWFDPLNWSDGVPDGPADTARIAGSATADVRVDITAPAVVGQLDLFETGSLIIGGADQIMFDRVGEDPASLQTFVLPGEGVNAEIAAPVAIADSQGLVLNVVRGNAVTLSGGIASATGDIVKMGEGELVLAGDSSGWNGLFTVTAGDVVLRHVAALGDQVGVTRIAGGRILIGDDPPPPRGTPPTTLDGPLAESFLLEAGVLETTQHFLGLEGTLDVAADNTATLRGPFSLLGGTVGDGDLRIVATESAATSVFDAPLAHSGGVEISSGESRQQFARFDVDNSYGGPTTLDNVRVDVRSPGGLGNAAVGTAIMNGSNLRLHGSSPEDVSAIDSTISLWSAEVAVPELRPTGRYSLHNSVLTTYGSFRSAEVYALTRPVVLNGGVSEIATDRGGIRLEGGIQGNGDLLLNPDGQYPIEIASPVEFDGRLEVRGGSVRFVEPDVFDGEIFAQNGARIVATVDQQFDKIRAGRLIQQGCCSPSANVYVEDGATLSLDRLEMVQGTIQGAVNVAEGLTFAGFVGGRALSHVDTEITVNVQAGVVDLNDTLPGLAPSNVHVRLLRSSEAAISVEGGAVTDATFFLNNSSGMNFGGALILNSDFSSDTGATLRGDIHLGDRGAHIGGTEQEVRIEGQVFGGDLNLGRLRGTPGLNFVQQPAAYIGATRIYSGRIILSENGGLTNTDSIEIFANGAMYADFSTTDAGKDRISDSTPVVLNGGEIAAWPNAAGVNAGERVNAIHVNRGLSAAHGTVFTNGLDELAAARLTVGEIIRSPGAVLMTEQIQPRIRVIGTRTLTPLDVENPPPVTNGILPPWLLSGRTQFAAIGPDGIEAYSGPTVSLADSDPTSIVRPRSPNMLEDRTIHAWNGIGSTPDVDLNGHQLTIGSGGLIGPKLANGVIVPGQDANGELIIATDFVVDADIQDGSSPTSVVYIGEGEIGGNNSYTGKTYVTGLPGNELTVNSATALPVGGDIEVNGNGEVRLRDRTSGIIYDLGNVTLRDGAGLFVPDSAQGMTARRIDLESGILAGQLIGDFPIVKHTDGAATLSGRSPNYAGVVEVMAGTLVASEGPRAFGQATVNVRPGGRVTLPLSGDPGPNAPVLNLHGGSLLGSGHGTDGVSWSGDIHVLESSTVYTLDGMENSARSADITVDGTIHVADGKSLSVLGRPDTSRGFRVLHGIQLGSESILAGTAAVRSHVEISQGAILSPGMLGQHNTVGMLATSKPISANENDESLMTWGAAGRYRWEINDANGVAGAPFGTGWDLLRIGQQLDIRSNSNSPFVIEPVALNTDGELGLVTDLAPNRTYRWLIAEIGTLNAFSAKIVGFSESRFAIDASSIQQIYPHITQDDFWLTRDSQGIHLNLQFVPEPNAACLVLIAIVAWRTASRRKCGT